MAEAQEFNEGHIVEGLDRCNIIISMISDLLVDHPAVLKSDAQGPVCEALNALHEAYQRLGSLEEGS